MLRFGETELAKGEFYGAKKKKVNIWDAIVDNIVSQS